MNKSILQPATKLEDPLFVTEDEAWEAAEYIMKAMTNTRLCDSLNIIRHNGFYLKRNLRSIKIKERFQLNNSGFEPCPCTVVPEVLLRGKWLQKVGFQPGNMVWVLPFADLLIVIPQEGLKK